MTKYLLNLMLGASLLFTGSAYAEESSEPKDLTPQEISKLSEAFGHFIGRNLKSPGVDFNVNDVIKGIRDEEAGKPSPLSDQEYEQMMGRLQSQAYRKQAEENLKKANAFLEKESKEPGVVVIEPGKLEYITLKKGDGPVVEPHSSPQIHYTGKYIDGTVFGSSEEAGEPITIPLDQTIQGFSKGIVGMHEGGKRRLFVHPDLGYGISGPLPPNSLLILDVEVVKADTPEDEKEESDKEHKEPAKEHEESKE